MAASCRGAAPATGGFVNSWSSVEQVRQVLAGQRLCEPILAEQLVGERGLPVLQLPDLFLDRSESKHAIGDDRLRLPDAVRAIDRLRFDGRVPPGIEQDDVTRRGQVEAGPPGLQRDQ